jgi:RHS repeat-associated protein
MLHVNVATGEVCVSVVDFSLPGFIPFEFERNYRSRSGKNGALGWNWHNPLNTKLSRDGTTWIYQDSWGALVAIKGGAGDGERSVVARTSSGTFTLSREVTPREVERIVLQTPGLRRIHFPLDPRFGAELRPSHVEDGNRNTLSFEYDARGNLSLITDTCGRQLHVSCTSGGKIGQFRLVAESLSGGSRLLARYEYDQNDDLVAVYDALGNAVRFEYSDHLLVRAMNKLGGAEFAEYDDRGRCINTWRDGGSRRRQIAYDERRQTTSVTNSLGDTSVFRWNDGGLVTEEVSPLGNTRTNLCDANGVLASVNEAGEVSLATIYHPDERKLTVVDAAGGKTVFLDDENGNVISKTDAAGGTWTWNYDERGNLIAAVSPLGSAVRFEYDTRGFLVRALDPQGSVVTQSRTEDGRRLVVRDEIGIVMAYEFDHMGDLVTAVDGTGARYRVLRDELGRAYEAVAPDGSTTSYHYDAGGNLVKRIDEAGNVASFEYDRFGRCLGYIGPQGTTVRYAYDSEDSPIEILDEAGQAHSYEYDSEGRVVGQRFFDGTEERYRRDAVGTIGTVSDDRGGDLHVTYNSVRSMLEKRLPDGASERFSYDGLRRLVDLESESARVHLEWDSDGNLVEEHQGDTVLKYEYDKRRNRVSMAVSNGRTVCYDYDQRSRLVRMDDSSTGVHRFDYDAADRVIRQVGPNGATLELSYDSIGRIVGEHLISRGGQSVVRTHAFDPAGRLISTNDSLVGHRDFEYDAAHRLLAVKSRGETVERFGYDVTGNLTLSPELGSLEYGRGNLLVRTAMDVREYDERGQLSRVRRGHAVTAFEYDGAGRLRRVVHPDGSITKYSYDPFGRRVAKEHDGRITRFVWDGFILLQELSSAGRTDYLFDTDRLVPLARSRSGTVTYFAADRRGTVFATSGVSGEIEGLFEYEAFGALTTAGNTDGTPPPFRLRGQYYDEETGLHYSLHRYFEPATGRFITRDPLGIAAGRNLYQFGPNPITWEDPFGLSSECQGDVFYRAMSDKEKKKVMADCQLHAKASKCPEGPYVTQNREEAASKLGTGKKKNKYEHLVEICTKPGTAAGLSSHPLACRNGSQAAQFPGLPDVVSGNPNRIEHKMENGNLNHGLSKGQGLDHFNQQVESMKVVGTGETCTPTR